MILKEQGECSESSGKRKKHVFIASKICVILMCKQGCETKAVSYIIATKSGQSKGPGVLAIMEQRRTTYAGQLLPQRGMLIDPAGILN